MTGNGNYVNLPNNKTPQKLEQYIFREIGTIMLIPTTVLTNFEYESHTMTGNGSYVNLQKLEWKHS